jgi:ATP-dependent Lon protease
MSFDSEKIILPVLPLKDIIVFPNTVYPVIVGRNGSVDAIELAEKNDGQLFLLLQKNHEKDDILGKDLYRTGVVAQIVQMVKLPNGLIKVLIEGLYRAKATRISNQKNHIEANISYFTEFKRFTEENIAFLRTLQSEFRQFAKMNPNIADEIAIGVNQVQDNHHVLNYIMAHLPIDVKNKQKFLEILDISERLKFIDKAIRKEIAISEIQSDVQDKVRDHFMQAQKNQFIREQIRVLRDELGESESSDSTDKLRQKVLEAKLPEHAHNKALEEVEKIERTPIFSPESNVSQNYLDWLLDIPWHKKSDENIDLKSALDQLNKDHYGLEEIKDRILDYLSILKINATQKGPILCLIGPPGVGKTSLGKSIADSMKREFVRISLGGIRDEAEIRGHRKTYIGAMPGKILQSMKKAKTTNPVILLDEIDKLASDFRGDPASALLEVLDPEQNHSFTDHFLEIEYDLSQVVFLATANYFEGIPAPLLDRMEVIQLNSYLEREKEEITKSFLLPKILDDHKLDRTKVTISSQITKRIIRHYTREAGVRQLKQELSKVIRKVTRYFIENPKAQPFKVNSEHLTEFLGKEKFKEQVYKSSANIGVAIGLAWTASGGDLLPIEINLMPGKGKLVLTGKLGDVMKESAHAALTYIRSNVNNFDIDPEFHEKTDIHIHVPEGAIPKDGPSAGITITSALLSALKKKSLKNIAMTGEITLRGHVLAIGGLKEKLTSALRYGIKEVTIPFENENDYLDLSEDIRKELTVHFAKNFEDVIKIHNLV